MKCSKAYVLIKTRNGAEQSFFSRLQELGLKCHDRYTLFGSGFNIIVELVHQDVEELDGFMHAIQRDKVLAPLVLDEMRLISYDKDFIV
ncbi:MAG: hypothetical protein JW839_08940 [Candidatus Lokiarchaeota archaeon]|nr:hypothetical protein [Candidatus Lokiarchaeota archaeon]